MTFGDSIPANQIGPIKVMQMSFLVMVPALFFLTNSTTQMTATLLHCSWYRRLFPFCAL